MGAKNNQNTYITKIKSEARSRGDKVYNTGKPCWQGHLSDRFLSTGHCVKCYESDIYKEKAYIKRHPLDLEKRKDFLIYQAKRNAKAKGMEFLISKDDLEWPTHCLILGIELDYPGRGGHKMLGPSFDRKDSSKGYIKGNVFVISNRANSCKGNMTTENVRNLLRYME